MTPKDPGCIFCKIVAGQIPCHKLLENEHVLAFLDIAPLSRGHVLVIPRGHWATLDTVPEEVAAALGAVLPKLSRAASRVAGTGAWNVLQNNGRAAHQVVDHVHFHVIPRYDDQGLGIHWPAGKLGPAEASELLAALRQHL